MVGEIGSGKSLSMIRRVIMSPHKSYVNFDPHGLNAIRMKNKHVFRYEKDKKGKYSIAGVNWKFWENQQAKGEDFNVLIDEGHNKLDSRTAMTKQNIIFKKYLSQIRKMLGPREKTDFVIITQDIYGIDVHIRRLCQYIIEIHKTKLPSKVLTKCLQNRVVREIEVPVTYVWHTVFKSGRHVKAIDAYEEFRMSGGKAKSYDHISYYYANPFFRFNDSYGVLDNDSLDPEGWF